MTSNLDAALALAARGFRLIPLYDPGPKGKRPRIDNWQNAASSDADRVHAWWIKWPSANVGAAMGGPARLVAIDVDGPEGEVSAAGLALPPTLTSVSGSRAGRHLFFRLEPHHDLARIRNAVRFRPGLDVRAEGGQVALPPSLHEAGNRYVWDNDLEIAPLPDHLYAIISADPEVTRELEAHTPRDTPPLIDRIEAARKAVLTLPPAIAGQGGHNALLVAATTAYRGFDLPRAGAALVLNDYNRTCAPPWSPAELAHKLNAVEANERVGEAWGYLLEVDDMSTALAPDPEASGVNERSSSGGASGGIVWLYGDDAAKDLPPPNWVVPDLQICPGRATMIAGFGDSGKTLLSQALLLSVAAGKLAWSAFPSRENCTVRHFDHEQGTYATLRRYQRIAKGMHVDLRDLGKRFAVACFPAIHLNDKDARSAYARACAGADLVLIDALRGATPGEDENDSKIRACVDHLGWVSEKIGCAFVLIHHSGKGKTEDNRASPRGSSAIFDGCGCVLQVTIDDPEGPRHVAQSKMAAESEGGRIKPFGLSIDDVDDRGLRVSYRALEAPPTLEAQRDQVKADVLSWLEAHPGETARGLRTGIAGRNDVKDWALEALLRNGEVVNRAADRRAFALYTRNNDTGKLV